MSIPRSGQFTSIAASSSSPSPFEIVTTAVLSTVPQVRKFVSELRWTVRLVAGPMSPNSQVRTPPSIAQCWAPVPPSIDQPRLSFVGRVSVSTTSRAIPGPPLATVIVKPIDLAGVDGLVVGGLVDRDTGALDDDRRLGGVVVEVVVGLVRGGHGGHVHELAAVGGVGLAPHVDRARGAAGEVAEVAAQHAACDLAVVAVLLPGDAAGQLVGERDVLREAVALVLDHDRERRGVAGARSCPGRLSSAP